MAHVSQKKIEIVDKLKELIKEYPIVGSVNMDSLPTPQLQNMRAQLRGKVVLYMAKRRLIRIALEEMKDKVEGLDKLEEYLRGMPALLFTRDNPFSLYQTLKKNKSSAPAKAGQIAPKDIIVPAGPTGFAPGPIISELGGCGIKAGIEGGKVVVKADSLVVKEGEVISAKMASILTRLKIEPMEIGLDLVAVYENGDIMTKSILAIEPAEYIANVSKLAKEAFAVAESISYVCDDTIMALLTKAHRESRAISTELAIVTEETIGDLLAKAEAHASAVNKLQA
jgi:large subunit ribosomal protein L10